MDLERFVADVNHKVVQRGVILQDGQLLTAPLGAVNERDVSFQGDFLVETPPRRKWGPEQRNYFGLEDPYQMADEGDTFTQSHIYQRIPGPYLFKDEHVAALLHGLEDNAYYYCPCHYADVVYTTRHRLICMGCGYMHAVLCRPLPVRPKRLLTQQEWIDFFDDAGSRRDEEIDLSVVDFREVENAEMLWVTDQWEEAKRSFVFLARSPPDVVAEALRGTEADASIFMEAGFEQVALSPPPAHQVADDSIDVDLVENAAHSLQVGIECFLASRKDSGALVNAIPGLFRAVELLLKKRLLDLDPHGLDDQPNNPTVLKRVVAKGAHLSKDETETVNRLRRLRNSLQHGSAKFNHRTGLSVCRKTLIFLDEFLLKELKLWIGDACLPVYWRPLLAIPELAANAQRVVMDRVQEARGFPGATVSICPECGQDTMVRPHPKSGASCLYCLYVPVVGDVLDEVEGNLESE